MNVQLDHRKVAPEEWPAERLQAARREMDPVADRVVDQVFAAGERAAVNALLVQVVQNDQLVPQALPEHVQRYLCETAALPEWADPAAIERGEQIFATHGPLCFAVLIASSLPETYALRSIAQVLGTTQELEAHATRRILKTAQLLVDVLSPGGLGPAGRGVRAAQRVRLLHAAIRHLVLAGPAPDADRKQLPGALSATAWDSEQRGLPICQEDMAYTILTFSYVVLAGLERLQQELSEDDRDAFVHTWAVVGALMGVRDDLLPRDFAGAERLHRAIYQRQAGGCEAGRLLTRRTLDAFYDLLRTRALPSFLVSRGLPVLIARSLMAERTAAVTGVPELSLLQRLVALPVMHLATLSVGFADWLAHRDRAALFVQKVVARHLVDHLAALPSGATRGLFELPEELRRKWSAKPDTSAPQPLIERIAWIERLGDQPALRNLLITQCYHDLSCALAGVLGGENANWCSYATWASKTAGRFIRNEEIPELFRGMLADSSAFRASAARAVASLRGVHGGAALHEGSLLDIAEDVAGEVSGQITAGNLAVFSELAPVFARFVALFQRGSLDERAAAALLQSLKEGPSDRGGQSLLREALEQFLAAARESDPRKRAARMLVGNAQTGLHEQIRLQPYIAGSLQAPVEDTLGRLLDRHIAGVAATLLGPFHGVWGAISEGLVQDAKAVWCDFATKELMTLAIPGQLLHLGSRLPAPPGAPLYPPLLEPLDDADARALLEHYAALDPGARGDVGATDWADLTQRMRYILALFRSRQCDARMQQAPFSDAQRAAMLHGRMPQGPL